MGSERHCWEGEAERGRDGLGEAHGEGKSKRSLD